jgi:hypothetical protein
VLLVVAGHQLLSQVLACRQQHNASSQVQLLPAGRGGGMYKMVTEMWRYIGRQACEQGAADMLLRSTGSNTM